MGDKSPSSGASGTGSRRSRANQRYVAPTNITSTNNREEALEIQQSMFGRELSSEDLATLVGAQEGSHINVQHSFMNGGMLVLRVTQSNISGAQERHVKRDSEGNLVIYNAYFKAREDAPDGFGTKVFTDQVKGARQMGVKRIDVTAAGDYYDSTFNGYYTWARLGYDGPLGNTINLRGIPDPIKKTMNGGTNIQDLYRTQEGRDWWKRNGSNISLSFDTDPGSLSSRVLEAYNEERSKRKKG